MTQRDELAHLLELQPGLSRPAPGEVAGVGRAIGSPLDALDLRETADPLEGAADKLAAAREALARVRDLLDGQE
jgi:hypothetical protein